jgi:hypothetical protein
MYLTSLSHPSHNLVFAKTRDAFWGIFWCIKSKTTEDEKVKNKKPLRLN